MKSVMKTGKQWLKTLMMVKISEKLNDRLVEETEQMYLDNPKSISFFAHLIQTKKVEIRIAFKNNNFIMKNMVFY